MSSNVPLNLDENKLFKDWTAKLPLSKKWLALTNPPEDDGAGKRGEKGKDKEKKGAKKPAAKKT
ncbi:MAG: hypothetical protein BJ554DRAFT_1471 [Olpidium bornovanus]|uniref:Uncharacterized protein n=1 Tax=Olpidium bornovanus TaxID=278681 RepID=A0A8H7ZRR7_9FUNG|nr:MAG: hypothetical protein BJ554DRAFT_1471 [Olpidium bornovanus]